MQRPIRIIDKRNKHYFMVDDEYLNGYAKHLGVITSMVYISLCRHVDKYQMAFPSQKMIAEKLGVGLRSVERSITKLKKWNLIEIKRNRTERKWNRNNYYLLDKKMWKKLSPATQTVDKTIDHPPTETLITRHTAQHKDTHKKDTHNNTKVLQKPNGFGNQDINNLLDYLKEKMSLPLLDGSIQQNRNYTSLCIKKFGGVDKIKLLIDTAAISPYWQTKISSMIKLYYNGVQIMNDTRKGGVYDATNI